MKIKIKSIGSILISTIFVLSVVTACGSNQTSQTGNASAAAQTTAASTSGTDAGAASQAAAAGTEATVQADLKPYNYSAYFDVDTPTKWFDNPNDVVTKWYEDKYKLYNTDVAYQAGQTTDQRLAAYIASDSMPDVVVANRASIFSALDEAYDLTDLVPDHMPYYWNTVLNDTLRKTSTVDGKIKFLYKFEAFGITPETGLDDPYFNQIDHTYLIREDILTKLGYKFTPMADLIKKCNDEKRAPTVEDFAIDPVPYTTADEFVAFLRKINDLGLTDQAGNKIIPYSCYKGDVVAMHAFNFSSVWVWDDATKKAQGFLGSPQAKDAYHYLWSLYNDPDNLLDKDYIIQDIPTLQEKISTGRVAVFDSVVDITAANASLTALDPTWQIRPLPLPRNDPDRYGYTQTTTPYRAAMISKKVPPDIAARFLDMWEFMNTPEGLTITCFGPPDQLSETNSDGKLVFKEPLMSVVMQNQAGLPGGPEEYGVVGLPATYMRWGDYWSKIAYISAAPRHRFNIGIDRALDPIVDVLAQGRRIVPLSTIPLTPDASYPRGITSNMPSQFNSAYDVGDINMILTAKSESDFDTAWAYAMDQNETVGQYSAAQDEMDAYFNSIGFK